MKEIRFRLFIILGIIALCGYLLYPTYADYRNTQKLNKVSESIRKGIKTKNPSITSAKLEKLTTLKIDSIKNEDPSIKNNRAKRIKLGLDLQGGMYIVMEVNTAKMLEKMAKQPDETFMSALKQAENESKITDADVVTLVTSKLKEKGVRLSRYFGTIRDDDSKIIDNLKQQSESAVSRAAEIIRNRIDQYGVSEPSIQRQGSRRIVVELPGVAKEEEARQLLQGRAMLEFKMVKEANFAFPLMKRIDEILAGKIIDTSASDSSKAAETAQTEKSKDGKLSAEEFTKQHPFFSIAIINPQSPYADAYIREDQREKLQAMLDRPDVKAIMPDNAEFAFSAKPEATKDNVNIYRLYLLNKKAELTGGVVTDAQSNIDPQTTAPVVNMQMNAEGARDWARITGANVGKRIAVMLDGLVYTAPTVNGKIPNGNSQISGSATMEEAKLLEIVLKAGALPAPVDIMEERTVGPSLGEDSVSQGSTSLMGAFIFVGLLMLVYYAKAGGIADVALFFAVLFIFGVLAGFGATLTLPGIAGIVLTMGMAVDANVLVNERIREELATGKTMKAAIESGYKFSASSIWDSHITSFITGLILFQFGTGPIQGFALTLMIGIVTSLFGALVIARVIMEYMISKGHKLTLG